MCAFGIPGDPGRHGPGRGVKALSWHTVETSTPTLTDDRHFNITLKRDAQRHFPDNAGIQGLWKSEQIRGRRELEHYLVQPLFFFFFTEWGNKLREVMQSV